MTAWIIVEIALLLIFIGAIFISLRNHLMGDIIIYQDEDNGNKIFSFELDKQPQEIEHMKFVIFVVKNKIDESQNKQGL